MVWSRARRFPWVILCLSLGARLGNAQHPAEHSVPEVSPTGPSAGASAILLATAAVPGVGGRTLFEGYITQPMATASSPFAGGKLVADLMLNFEGLTLKRGELNAGMHGEGYVDRRHPHTWLHEAVVTGFAGRGATRFSITIGKGFVPFGTDDPMSRGFVKYPVNHHLAQLLERAGVFAAAALGPAVLEVASFNGDEPTSPSDAPDWEHIGDSWSVRATVRDTRGIEIQASLADVESPEISQGGGLDHRKLSASARYERRRCYGLVEWARTSERDQGREAFAFSSMLAEGSVALGSARLGLRAERSERGEEERLTNPFRTPSPHSDLNILGRTRWDVLSASISRPISSGRGTLIPFIEVSTQRPKTMDTPAIFDPEGFYGAARLWSFSAGLRAGIGKHHNRMGRYGVAAANIDHSEHQ